MSVLMVQGTSSDAGKSALVTGLCRVLARQGIRVAPFKPQNMALNSAVTVDGGEIGRAQALQALAAGIDAHTDMNPVLLKPNSDTGSQVIIQGHAVGNMDARTYHSYKPVALQAVLDSYRRLAEKYDVVLVEGAGSPAEINLRENDIANMGFAEAIQCPVLLVADINRGGVLAQLAGTLSLLSETERALIKGLVINRFRGDRALLQPAVDWLEQETGKAVSAVLPFLDDLHLEGEDSLTRHGSKADGEETLKVIIPALPRLSNHTDFDPLNLHPQVSVEFVSAEQAIPAADLIILPGSKSVRRDLQFLRDNGWQQAIARHLRYGGKLLGICGGFQMLGHSIHDPQAIEGPAGSCPGLAYLDMSTTLDKHKQLRNVRGRLALQDAEVHGYEIHAGVSQGAALQQPAIYLHNTNDGAISADGQVMGTYLHGLFESPAACAALLAWAGLKNAAATDYAQRRERDIQRIADAVQTHFDMDAVCRLLENKLPIPARQGNP